MIFSNDILRKDYKERKFRRNPKEEYKHVNLPFFGDLSRNEKRDQIERDKQLLFNVGFF